VNPKIRHAQRACEAAKARQAVVVFIDEVGQYAVASYGETEATCLWLRGLSPLHPTQVVEGREDRIFRMPPGANRQRERSRFYPGIAAAMASQWGRGSSVQLSMWGAA